MPYRNWRFVDRGVSTPCGQQDEGRANGQRALSDSDIGILARTIEKALYVVELALQRVGMSTYPAPTPPVALRPAPLPEVAGRIDAATSPLSEAVDGWMAELEGNGASPNTIRAWRPMVVKDIADAGWTVIEHLDYANVQAFLTRRRSERGWSAATYRQHLTALKSLDRYLKRTRDGDLQAMPGGRDMEPGQGARASTIEEARAMIAAAWECERNDRRCRSPRALYYLCLFALGCRECEPALWQWKHLTLDGPHPSITFEPWMHKAKRRTSLALTPELARKLSEHRSASGNPPPEAKVFRYKPPRHVWQRDRERAGIPYKDERGRAYTQHSARKGYKTQLVRMGLLAEWIDHAMRHTTHVGTRYFDPSVREQAEQLSTFPPLWPEWSEKDSAVPQPRTNPGVGTPNSTAGKNLDEKGVAAGPDDRLRWGPMEPPAASHQDRVGGWVTTAPTSDLIAPTLTGVAALLRATASLLEIAAGTPKESRHGEAAQPESVQAAAV